MKKENRIFPVAAIAALVLNFVFLQGETYKIPVWFIVLACIVAVMGNILAIKKKASAETKRVIASGSFIGITTIVFVQLICLYREGFSGNQEIIAKGTGILAVLMIVVASIFLLQNRKIEENSIFLLLLLALGMRVFYVSLTGIYIFQNDVGALIPYPGGHLNYIHHVFANGTLPDIDPREFQQAYQPPLHYVISALWLKINCLFGAPVEKAAESLHALSLFYTVATLGFMNKIGIRLNISAAGRFIAIGFMAFMPYSIIMSGSVNNDALMTLFVVMALYMALKWYEEPTMKNILLMAVNIGCAMMSKLSAGLVAPGIAVIMLVKAWKERKSFVMYLKQFCCFGLVVFPLGLWYPIRNLLRFDLPLTYVPLLGEDVGQYIGNYTFKQRLFELGDQLNPLCLQWERYEPNISYNIPVSLVKFATFGEGNFYLLNGTIKTLGTWMFYFTAGLLVAAFIFSIVWLFQKKVSLCQKAGLGLAVGILFASYLKFCVDYPHVCTMHIRYIMVPVFVGLLCMGGALTGGQKKQKLVRAMQIAGVCSMALYGIVSILMMLNLQLLLS